MATPRRDTIEQVKARIEQLEPEQAQRASSRTATSSWSTRASAHEYAGGAHRGRRAGPAAPRSLDRDRARSPPTRSQRVILYCASGNRSARAADQLGAARLRERRLGRRRHQGVGGRRACPSSTPEGMTARAADALLAPHAAARGRRRGPAEAAEREGAAARRRRARLADRALPRRRRHRHARARRRRRGRRVEPAAPGDPQHRARRPAQDRVGATGDRGAQPRRRGGRAPHPPRRLEHPRDHQGLRRRSSTAPTTSRPATCSTTPRCGCASRSSRPRSSPSTARSRPSCPSRARATAASTRPRRPPSWRRAAAPPACSA